MKTSVIDIRDLLSPLSAQGVEKQYVNVPWVEQADMNNISGSVTVRYDDPVTSLIRSRSRATLRKIHQNLWGAVGYNLIAFPLAAGVLYPFTLSPEIAALAMSGSSLWWR